MNKLNFNEKNKKLIQMETLNESGHKKEKELQEDINKSETERKVEKISKGGRIRKIITKTQEITVILFLSILPWLSFTYTNFLNLIYGIFLIVFVFDIKYKNLMMIKKALLTFLLIINILDNLIRIVLFILFKQDYLDYKKESLWKELNLTLRIYAENFSLTFYHFLISFLISFCLFFYIVFKSCFDIKQRQEYISNIKTLKRLHNIKYFLVLFSYILICFSVSCNTNLISMMFILMMFFTLILWVSKFQKFRKKVHKIFGYFTLIFLILILIPEYLMNTQHIYSIIVKDSDLVSYYKMIWVIFFYDDNKEDPENYNFLNLIYVALLVNVMLINCLFLKCKDYKLKINNYDKNSINGHNDVKRKKIINKSNKIDLDKKTEDKENENKESNIFYVSSYDDDDIIIKFQNKNEGFFRIFSNIINNYIYSPFFILHFCRIGILIWLGLFKSYTCFIFILWLFRSFTIKSTSDIKIITNYITFPFLIIDTIECFLANIPGIEIIHANVHNEDFIKDLGLEKYSDQFEITIKIFIKLLVTHLFSIFVYTNTSKIQQVNLNMNYSDAIHIKSDLKISNSEIKNEEINNNSNVKHKNSADSNKPIVNSEIINHSISGNDFINFNENNLFEPLMVETATDLNKINTQRNLKYDYILSFSEILLKLLFKHIDKISILFVYLECVRYVNVEHLILMIIFFIKLSSPKFLQKICIIVICIVEVIILTHFTWEFISNKIIISDSNKEILDLFFLNQKEESTFNNIFLWIAIYCFYLEYQSYSSKLLEIYKYKKLDLYEYINFNLANKPKILKFLKVFFDFSSGIYVWLLFFSFSATIFFIETNLLQGIKLITLLVLVSSYSSLLESNFTRKIKDTLSVIWALIIISGIVSFSIYLFQFFELELLKKLYNKDLINYIPDFIISNAKLFGFEIYKSQMKYSVIPYYAGNILSILIYYEVNRVIIKKTRKNSGEYLVSNSIYSNNKEDSRSEKYFYKFLFVLLKYYWIVVFVSVFWLIIDWKFSISMLTLMIIIVVITIRCYTVFYNSFNSNCEKLRYITNFQKMLKNYSEEKEEHFKVSFKYRKKAFKILMSISIIYIAITYFFSLVIDMNIENTFFLKEINFLEYFRSYSYLLGFHYSNHDFNHKFFFQAVFGYILIIFILIAEKIFQTKCFEYYSKKVRNKTEKKSSLINQNLETVKEVDENVFDQPTSKFNSNLNLIDDSMKEKNEQINSNSTKIISDSSNQLKPITTSNATSNKITDFKKINDPLSISTNHENVIQVDEPGNSNNTLLKTNLKSSYNEIIKKEDGINVTIENRGNEAQIPVQRNKSFHNLTRTLTLQNEDENEVNFKDQDILQHNDIKKIFRFPEVFSRHRSQTDLTKRNSSQIIDIRELNNIIQYNNEEIYIMKTTSTDEEELESKEDTKAFIENEQIEKVFLYNNSEISPDLILEEEQDEVEIRTRKRKNATHKKQTLIKYSLEFQIVLKNIIQEIILFLLLFSAILKINILSFIYLSTVLVTYKSGNKLRSIFYVTCIVLFFFIVQLSLFTSNLSRNTCPTNNVIVLNEMNNFIGIPWYPKVSGFRWGMFFSLGVCKFQISSLWIDIIIMLTIYIYLEFFSFAVFEIEFSPNSNKIAISEYEKAYKKISNFSEDDYERFKKSMKVSFDIDIQDINTKKYKDSTESPDYKVLVNKAYAIRNPTKEKENHFILYIYKNLKRYIYLTFHNITLIIILIFSMMNDGLISIPYIIFSIVYIYKTHNFLVGNQWTFQHALKYILKPYLFVDLTGQLLCQVPFEFFILYNNPMNRAMNIIGFERLIVYNSPESIFRSRSFSLVLLKITTYLLISLQEIIYNSNDFKMFILRYHLKMKEKSYLKGKLHAFIFNNSRIMLMNQRIKERQKIDQTLTKIESTLSKWHEKMFLSGNKSNKTMRKNEMMNSNLKRFSRKRNISCIKNDLFSNLNLRPNKKTYTKSANKKLEEFSIKKILKKYWLINLALYLHEQATMLLWNKITTEENVERILRGNMNVKSDLEEAIELFDKENEDKFNLLKNLVGNINLNKRLSKEKKKSILFENNSIDENEYESDGNIEQIKLKLPEGISKKESILSNDFNLNNYLITDIASEDKDEFFVSTEYYEIKNSIRYDFFKNYYSKFKIIRFIVYDILIYFAQNFEYVCYFLMVLNHVVYSSLISLAWPILVFCAGIINYPRPRKFFWKFSIIYSSFVICLKFFFQIALWPEFFKTKAIADIYGNYNFKDRYRLGIKLYQSTFSFSFFSYMVFDFIIISVLIAQQFMLIRRGLWSVIETDLESIEEANNRIHKYKAKEKLANSDDMDKPSELKSEEINQVEGIIMRNQKISLIENLKRYYAELFPILRNEKPGKDLYVYYTLFQMIIILYIIFFYTKLDQDTNRYNEDTIKNLKQFSVNMILFSFFHVFLIVLDRYIYLKNLRKIEKLKFNIYDTQSGDLVKTISNGRYSTITNFEELEDLKTMEEGDEFEIVYLQYESFQRGLIYKYILQIFLVLFVHVFVFFYFPIKGNFNLHNSSICENENKEQNKCNEFADNIYLIIFYIFYCGYFVFSGLQIKYNMIDLRKQSVLMRGDNLVYSTVFKTFKAMPFLYEIKLLIDWTFTKTSLDLFKWLKFEAIYDLLFITKCTMKSYYGRKLGTKIPRYNKFFSGGLLFFLVLVIVFGPLVLFSSLNPTNKPNQVKGATSELQLVILQDGVFKNFTLFHTTQIQRKNRITDKEWMDNNFHEIVSTKNYYKDQVQTIEIFENSENAWLVSPATLNYIMDTLENPKNAFIYLNLKYSFNREVQIGDFFDPYSMNEFLIYQPKNNSQIEINIFSKLKYSFSNCLESTLVLPKFYNPAIRLGASAKPIQISESEIIKEDLYINFLCTEDKIKYWQINRSDGSGLTFFTFSDMVSPTTASYNVLSFYLAFVLVIGSYIRTFISGETERVIYTEMPRPNKLLNLCEGIKISRYKKDLEREDQLYYVLIDLLRSPEMLKMITKPSIQINSYKSKRNKVVFY